MSYVQKKWNSKWKWLFYANARIVLKAVAVLCRVWLSVPFYTLAMFPVFPQKKQPMLKQVDKYYICSPGPTSLTSSKLELPRHDGLKGNENSRGIGKLKG